MLPATYALNPNAGATLAQLSGNAAAAIPLIRAYGDDRKADGVAAATAGGEAGGDAEADPSGPAEPAG